MRWFGFSIYDGGGNGHDSIWTIWFCVLERWFRYLPMEVTIENQQVLHVEHVREPHGLCAKTRQNHKSNSL